MADPGRMPAAKLRSALTDPLQNADVDGGLQSATRRPHPVLCNRKFRMPLPKGCLTIRCEEVVDIDHCL